MIESKKTLKRIIAIVLIVFVVAAVLPCAAYSISFLRYDAEQPRPVDSDATKYLFGSDGDILGGMLFESQGSDTLIVFAPGFHASLNDYLSIITHFCQKGYSVFYFDPLGSGMSTGKSGIGFSRELIDMENAVKFVNSNNNFGNDNLVLFGHSRGGYAACCAVAKYDDIDAVVSVSGINSAMEGITEPIKEKVSYAAYIGWPALWLYNTILFGDEYTDVSAAEVLSTSEVPALIIHGSDDRTAPADEDAITAYSNEIANQNAEYYICEKPGQNGHTDLLFDPDGTENDELMERITDFISSHIDE